VASRRIGLVGCVKQKAMEPRAAKDLYVSTLFAGRRSFEETGKRFPCCGVKAPLKATAAEQQLE